MLYPNGTPTRPTVTSPFGWRVHPVTGKRTLHAGADLVGLNLVRAVDAGTVVAVGTPRGWEGGGIQVWIQHAGYLSRYMHMKSTPAVHEGETVTAGRILGIPGMTGTATGVHLHLEIAPNGGSQVDPLPFIAARLTSLAGGTSKPATTPRQEDEMALHTIRDTERNTIFFADEFGIDHVPDFISADIGSGEYLAAEQKAFGNPTPLTAREFDIANAIALRRWERKKAEIVAAIVPAVLAALKK